MDLLYRVDQDAIKWQQDEFSPVYSLNNFYKNANSQNIPFHNGSGLIRNSDFISNGDLGGKNSAGRVKINPNH